MESKTIGKMIPLFYAYRVVSRFYLYLPVMVVFLLGQNLSYPEVGLVLAAYGFAVMVSKPLVGIALDIWPKKAVLFAGEWMKCLGVAGLAWDGNSVAKLIVAQAVIGFGFSCTQGTDSMLLSQWTEKSGDSSAYRKIESKSQSYIFIAVLVSGVAGALLAEIDIRMPFYLTVPFNFVAAFLALGFREEFRPRLPQFRFRRRGEAGSAGILRKTAHVVSFYAVNRATIMAYYVLALPLLLFVQADVSVGYFGVFLGLFSLTAFLAGQWLNRLAAGFGEGVLWAAVPCCILASSLLLMSDRPWAYWPAPVLLGFAAGVVRPLAYGFFQKEAEPVRKAAIASAEFWFALFNAGFVLALAALFDWSVRGGLAAVMAAVAALSLCQLFWRGKPETRVSKTV
ncbi:MFS transporter [Hydrogenophilus thiooxidans]|uniref:MFS transporter n=1 Tax=Hydrogenophilus thiooxidans TaxID=2820326 RepID=UPI001C238453|nr:MFS transporter [Hydrogenophilus thiooxidans]